MSRSKEAGDYLICTSVVVIYLSCISASEFILCHHSMELVLRKWGWALGKLELGPGDVLFSRSTVICVLFFFVYCISFI